MALPTPDQVIPQALVRERIPATPPAGSAAELARRINEQNDQGNWKGAFERSKMPQVERGKIEQVREQIGVERNPATGAKVRTPQEQARYDQLGTAAALSTKFLEEGYDRLTAGEQVNLRRIVLDEARLRPALAGQLSVLAPNQVDAFAIRLLKEPKMAAKIREVLTQQSDPEHKLADAVTPADQQFKEKDLDRQNKQEEVDDVNRRLTAINTRLAEFARPGMGAPPGAKAAEIDRIKTNFATIQAELRTQKQRLVDAKYRKTQLEADRTASIRAGAGGMAGGRTTAEIDTEITDIRREETNAQTEIDTREADLQKLPQLEQEEQQLEQRRQEIERERRERSLELGKAQLEAQKRQYELQDARALRGSHEEDLVQGFETVFAKATSDLIGEQVDEAAGKFETEIETLKQQTKVQEETAMYNTLQTRWLGPLQHRGILRRVSFPPINRACVSADMETLLDRAQGSDQLMRNILRATINPTTRIAYTNVEVDGLMANKAFVDKMRPEAITQLLGRRALTGGFTQGDIHVIVNSQWGQGMIEAGLAKNAEYRGLVESALGADALRRQGFIPRVIEETRKHPFWLLSLLGIPFLVGGAIRTTATQESIST